ncbi:MAG: PASTA domain-containing protein [Clostridia bacterium]|nr:PASTA domain-containing protein [Clostridia bacterium]
MISSDNLCMGCMHEIGEEKKCPYCGYHVDAVQSAPYLPVRTVIGNRYLVGKVVDYNGEGATYIGWDLMEKKAVNIREFMPSAITARSDSNLALQVRLGSEATYAELRRSFEELWGKLAKLNGLSALINVTDVIEDNSTSYAVYDHFDGITLQDFLLRSKTGYITWEKARQLLMPTLSTLGTLHSNGIIHRGISPSTLVIGEDGKIKITGFSIGDVRTVGSRLNPQIFDGYAAAEQYGFDVRQGPWTDIYSFTAVLYRTLIGSNPISAKERMANDRLMVPGKFAEALPAYVINGLINGLQILPQDRTKTVEQLRAELSASPAATAVSTNYGKDSPAPTIPNKNPQTPVSSKPPKKEKSSAAVFFIALASVLLIGAIALGIMLVTLDKSGKINLRHPGETTTETQTQVEQVKVPDFSVSNYDSIQANPVFNKNFKITANEVFNAELPKGTIISQSVPPDTLVPKGSSIVLTVSKGPEMIVLPNVVGKKYDEAYDQLTGLGFEVERMDVSQSGWYSDEEVIEMSLTENQEYDAGTLVTLKVYTKQVTEEFSTRSYTYSYSTTSRQQESTTAYTTTEPVTQAPSVTVPAENE